MPVITSESNVSGVEDFTITTPTALLTLVSELNREVVERYRLSLKVVDQGTMQTGTIVIKVKVVSFMD